MRSLFKSYEENVSALRKTLGSDENFDILEKHLLIAGHAASLFFIDGLAKDDILEKILEYFYSLKEEDLPDTPEQFQMQALPYIETEVLDSFEDVEKNLLSGVPCLFINGMPDSLAIDCRTYPARSVEEPFKDRTLRGSRDGFVETVVFNTALIRRRIRSPKLRMEMQTVGKSSLTDVVLCYMDDRVDRVCLKKLRERISSLSVDALTMNQESLSELLLPGHWFNPFPRYHLTERPDTASASILEGNIVLLVDNSPSAIILPTSLFSITEEANDYYFPPITGTYLRLSRFLIMLISLVLTPLFLLLMQHPA